MPENISIPPRLNTPYMRWMSLFRTSLWLLVPLIFICPVPGFCIFYLVKTHESNPLLRAVEDGNLAEVKKLLDQGSNVNERKKLNQCSALHVAASGGHVTIVQLLLARGADVKARDNSGYTPLHAAVDDSTKGELSRATEPQRVQIARLLLDNGANINDNGTLTGRTPLHIATYISSPRFVRFLLDNGANPNMQATDDGMTPLHETGIAGRDRSEVAAILLDHGADRSIKDWQGHTALDIASKYNPGAANAIHTHIPQRPTTTSSGQR